MNENCSKSYALEGLTFEKIKELLELKFTYDERMKETFEYEKELKEKYKLGTVEFLYGMNEIRGPSFNKFILILDKDAALLRLKEELENQKIYNEKLEQENKELSEQLVKKNASIRNVKNYIDENL